MTVNDVHTYGFHHVIVILTCSVTCEAFNYFYVKVTTSFVVVLLSFISIRA